MSNIKSPFKFLDSYTEDDSEYFFGRTREINDLYNHIKRNKVVVVFGPSGTGKTSLIRSGLNKKLSSVEWKPFLVRRNSNINESIEQTIRDELAKNDVNDELNTRDAIKTLASIYNRPVFFILEQFEEVLIFGDDAEKMKLKETLRELLDTRESAVPCQFIIVIREEFLGLFDKEFNNFSVLYERRMRVDPMREIDVKKVIRRTLAYEPFNITLENRDDVDVIYDALSDNKGMVSLPYLQVYLDQLWKTDYDHTPDKTIPPGKKYPALTFTTEEIKSFGEIEDVLQRFLTEQKIEIDASIKARFPDIADDFLNQVLNEFVSDYGTKQPILFQFIGDQYLFPEADGRRPFAGLDADALKFTLKLLENRMIIRQEGKTLELYHDILAKLIYGQMEGTALEVVRARVMLKALKAQKEIIPYKKIKKWESYIDKCRLSREEMEWFELCRAEREKERTAKEIMKLREEKKKEQEDKEMEYNQKLSWKNKQFLYVSLYAIAILLVFYVKSLKKQDEYYAIDRLEVADSISDKHAALAFTEYLRRYVIDTSKNMKFDKRLLSIATSPAFERTLSLVNFSLGSNAAAVRGLEVDISPNGRFIFFRSDSLGPYTDEATYYLFDTATDKTIDTFPKISYAYFVPHTDSIIFIKSPQKNAALANFTNSFILYDCRNVSKREIQLGGTENVSYSLFNLLQLFGRENDPAFRISKLHSGDLLVPTINIGGSISASKVWRIARQGTTVFDIVPGSLRVSGDGKYYGYREPGKNRFTIIGEDGGHKKSGYARYFDFADSNRLVTVTASRLYVSTVLGEILDTFSRVNHFPHLTPLSYRPGNDILFASALNYTRRYDFKTNKIDFQDESFAGVTANAIITFKSNYTYNELDDDGGRSPDSTFVYSRNRMNDNVKTLILPYRISGKLVVSESTGDILVTGKGPKGEEHLLFLYDSGFNKKGTFHITANDAYGFSGDGKGFYVVRNEQFMLFENKKYVDVENVALLREQIKNESRDISALISVYKNKFNARFWTFNW